MSGRHQPSSNRSFYLSLATSTLRAAIIIALVVGGIVVINSAFPESGLSGGASPSVSPTGPTGPTDTGTPTGTNPTGPTGATGQEPEVVDLPVAVRNGTSVSGLAGGTAQKLEDKIGVNPIQIDDAPSTVSVTTIYFRGSGNEDEAEYIASQFFKKIEPKIARLEAGGGVDRDVQIAIYLGTDYASSQS